ncbi:MAG: porin family protein [Bacteroidia bacterium]|jgi:hypothetical protein|tara:strand:+ start:1183 stop:1821 length:639 start_codon:yes stop_codon:yes gene_type:complete
MKYTSIIVFILISYTSKAQDSKFKIGLIGGPNYTSLFGNEVIKNAYNSGFQYNVGIGLDYHLVKRLSLISGLLLEQNYSYVDIHFTDQFGTPTYSTVAKSTFHQLNLPIALKIKLIDHKLNLYTNIGTNFQYLSKYVYSADDGLITRNFNQTNDYNRFNIGLITSLGSSYKITKFWNFSLEVRNNLGLSNAAKNGNLKINSTSLLFGIHYHI